MAILNPGFATPLPTVARSRSPRTLRARVKLTVQFGHERKKKGASWLRPELCGGTPFRFDDLRERTEWVVTSEWVHAIWHRRVEFCSIGSARKVTSHFQPLHRWIWRGGNLPILREPRVFAASNM